MRHAGIKKLPKDLTVGGNLDIRYTGITELPERLTVGGSLDIRYTGITELPERLTVGGNLYMDYTETTKLPEGLTVCRDIYWNEKICRSPIPLRQGDYVPGRYLYADGILTDSGNVRTANRMQ